MPANVTYEFSAAKEKFEAAKTDDEKLIALQEMLSAAPNHKGGENLRKDISRKIADLKNRMEKKAQAQKKSGYTINIKKEGAGQVVLVGLPNSGKSTFLTKFTNAKPLIAPYPYTTTKPEVGVLNFGGALIQIVELPAFLETKEMAPQIFSMIRIADATILIFENSNFTRLDKLIDLLEEQDIFVTKEKPKIDIVKSQFVGVSFVNEQNLLVKKEDAERLLKDAGFRSHTIILNQKTNMQDILLLINPRASYQKAIGVSIPISGKKLDTNKYKNIPLYDFSEINEINEKIFEMVDKIIIYTKKPGQKPDLTDPLVIDKNGTLKDAARAIHKDIYQDLKSAKVWGSTKYPGQTVSKEYILKNKDIVEFVV